MGQLLSALEGMRANLARVVTGVRSNSDNVADGHHGQDQRGQSAGGAQGSRSGRG